MRQSRQSSLGDQPVGAKWKISSDFADDSQVVLHQGETLEFLRGLSDSTVSLVVSSPPYNVGKEYESQTDLEHYLKAQAPVLKELHRILTPQGSVCWQVGNYVQDAESFPLDIYYYPMFKKLGFRLRNRIIWRFGHGVHTEKRLSPRYETLLWFTKSEGYTFNLDDVRVPSKYPGKRHYKGPKAGQPSGNPKGKNPSDIWDFLQGEWETGVWDIPNVKAAHPEKTIHPCQFPIELVERCVLAFSNEREWVLDPYAGVGSTAIAALKRGRRAICIDKEPAYLAVARERVEALARGELKSRPIGRPVMQPNGNEKWAKIPDEWKGKDSVY